MVLAHDVADDARRLAVGAVVLETGLLHGKQNAPMNGLQAVAHIGQGAAHDHAHRVIEVGGPHLLFDRYRRDVESVGRQLCGLISRSEEHTSELQSLMRISYAVFCLKKKKNNNEEKTK